MTRAGHPEPPEITVSGICEKYRLNHADALKLLRGVKPTQELAFGKRVFRSYDRKEVEAAIAPVLAKRRGEAAATTQQVEQPPPVVLDLAPLHARIDELQGQVEKLQEDVKVIHTQHVALLKAVEKVGLDLSNKLDSVQQSIDLQEIALNAAPASVPTPPPPPPAVPKRKVTILGLFDAHASHIEREFRDAFDLRIYNIDEAKGDGVINRMKASDAVFIMTRFVNHSVENLAKLAGVKPIRVTGGQTAIRDKLTELYCNPT